MKEHNVVVIGAGITGLSVSLNILKTENNVKLTVISDQFNDHTLTSWGAGGIFSPSYRDNIARDVSERWAKAAMDRGKELFLRSDAQRSGIMASSIFHLSETDTTERFNLALKFAPATIKLNVEQVAHLGNFPSNMKFATLIQSYTLDCRKYLSYLMDEIRARGGQFEQRKVRNLAELADAYDCIVVSCGLGARDLLKDENFEPIRGYTIRLRAPWVKHAFLYPDTRQQAGLYMIPHSDGTVIIGGYYQHHDDDLRVRAHERDDLLRRAIATWPHLSGAAFVEEWVGIRPQRNPYRLGRDVVVGVDGRRAHVVYNYGFGSNGISMAWGAGIDAARLVSQCLYSESKL